MGSTDSSTYMYVYICKTLIIFNMLWILTKPHYKTVPLQELCPALILKLLLPPVVLLLLQLLLPVSVVVFYSSFRCRNVLYIQVGKVQLKGDRVPNWKSLCYDYARIK